MDIKQTLFCLVFLVLYLASAGQGVSLTSTSGLSLFNGIEKRFTTRVLGHCQVISTLGLGAIQALH